MLREFSDRESTFRISEYAVSKESEPGPENETARTADGRTPSETRSEQLHCMKRILIGAPQLVGWRRAWDIYQDIKSGKSEYIQKVYSSSFDRLPDFGSAEEFRNIHRIAVLIIKREEEKSKIPKKRKATAENEGYSEPIVEPELENWRFQRGNVLSSLVEDKWRADSYSGMCHQLAWILEAERSPVEKSHSDAFLDILKEATKKFLKDNGRPVLTNELADFENPYMMKRSVLERLLHDGCVRNKLEESLVPEFLEKHIELTKLRCEADLPPEVLEPLQAFRGISRWSCNPEIRMGQKLLDLNALIDGIINPGSSSENLDATSMLEGRVSHKYRNHIGFVSTVPRGRRGGYGHGKPLSAVKEDLTRVRYPTLQRVAHSLPKDTHYRSQALHAIQVLERSRGWEFSDKTKAVNALKEVLDNLPSSRMLTGKLEKALPMVRYGRFAPGSLSSSHKFVRRKPSNLRRRNRIRMYFRSMTANIPLSRRWADRRAKNQARSKKKDSKR
jgi:hypothetical protein